MRVSLVALLLTLGLTSACLTVPAAAGASTQTASASAPYLRWAVIRQRSRSEAYLWCQQVFAAFGEGCLRWGNKICRRTGRLSGYCVVFIKFESDYWREVIRCEDTVEVELLRSRDGSWTVFSERQGTENCGPLDAWA